MEFEAVIGLEIHVQLNAPTKMFCDCPNRPGDRPNLNTCPVCLWLPGAFPRLSRNVLEKAVMTCLALNAKVQPLSAFDQKVYYYPDLPKGFQLSQFHQPLARDGWLEVASEEGALQRLRIREIHLEEDVARLVHEMDGTQQVSLVDFNRAGAPLVEIVTEPDMRSPSDAMEFLRALRSQIRYAGGADCSMEQGTMRADANISLRPKGSDELNTKVEVKNMNSIRHVGDAIRHEIERQAKQYRAQEAIVLHTRLWDPVKGVTVPMRAKFSGPCVPDPSVPEVVVSKEWLDELQARLPEMPGQRQARFISQFGLTREESTLMSEEREVADYFEAVISQVRSPRLAAQWISAHLLPATRDKGQSLAETPVTPARLAGLLSLIESSQINANSAKEAFGFLFESDLAPEKIVEQRGLRQMTDSNALEAIVAKLIADNPAAVQDYRNGVTKAIGFLVGQAMRLSAGKANPKLVREMIETKLSSQ